MKKNLFPDLPEDLNGLSDEEISERLAAHRAVARKIHTRDAEFYAENEIEPGDAEALVEEFQAGVVQIKAIEEFIAARADAEASAQEALDGLAAEAGVLDEPEVKAEGDEGDEGGDAEPAPEGGDAEAATEAVEVVAEAEAATAEAAAEPEVAVTAAAKPRLRLPRPGADRAPRAAEQESEGTSTALVAAAGIRGFEPGHRFTEREELAKALIDTFDRWQVSPGVRQNVVVASAKFEYPEERRLGDGSGGMSDTEKIMEVVGPAAWGTDPQTGIRALLADGGICAAPTPFYDLPVISVADRPVRDSLASFQATRGAVSVPGRLTLADVTTAVGTVTAAEDEQGGTYSAKTCQRIECDPYTDYEIAAHYACVEWGNFGARTWPERVAAFGDLVASAHARLAETYLLDGIDTASTQVTAAQDTYGYGAMSSLLSEILVAGAAMKSRHRASPNMRLRAILPFWTRELLVSDLRNSQFDRFSRNVAGVEALLREHGIEPAWHLDTSTGDGQIFGTQNAGALLTFPTSVKWWLFPEGSFLFLDGGTLDLGIVRDSTLNATNDFQMFMETFEQVAWLGIESLAITSNICPTGATGGPDTLLACAT